MDIQIEYQRYIDVVDEWIAERPKAILLAFLLLSAGFAVGLGQSGTSSGTSQFTEDVPAQAALDDINDNFERVTFEPDTGTTQLIQSGTNVLSKPELLRMLRAQERLRENPKLQVIQTSSVARAVAQTIDPSAETIDEEINAIEQATPSEIDSAVRQAVERNPALEASLSKDFNAKSASATSTIGIVTHSITAEVSDSGGVGDSSPLTDIQQHAEFIVSSVGGDITVFGSGITAEEFSDVINDSLALVVPAAVVLILFFLIIAYRDPIDLLIGAVSLGMAILWTFGFMGLAGIAFSQLLIAVPPLLLAIGIDFGIHAINRYREERVEGFGIRDSMRTATDQLLVAFAIVTGTTVLGFAANVSSPLGPIRDFALIAAIGIVFTFLIFGIFLPAAKVYADTLRQRVNFPEFGSQPLGSEDSALGKVLPIGVHIGRRAPKLFLIVLVLSTVWIGSYGAGVESQFTQDDFLPPEETPEYIEYFPEQLQPREYTVTGTTNFLEDNFETGEEDVTMVYVEGSLTNDGALESMWRAGEDPPASFVDDDGHARETSIVTVIRSYARQDQEFEALVERNDRNANGIPDDNLKVIYGALLDSPARERALNYITEDYTAARVEYAVESDASQAEVTADTRTVADRYRFEATATGGVVVMKALSDVVAESAFISLVIALLGTGAFLVIIYGLLEGRASLGIVNMLPIAVTVAALAATMRYLDIPFNVMTGTILSIGIGLGIDYSAHLVHRFAEEYDDSTDVFESLTKTVRGTGGALTGSMLTTVTGVGILVIAISPILGQFGLLTAASILYSYLASLIVLPPALVVWARFVSDSTAKPSTEENNLRELAKQDADQ
ncbi:RND transporter [Haloferax sp. AS1]|uniref:efflux RND transporter permease subunit n=1 Tax=Haloferax sp. AS1 TaxID=2562277 RepID=UPI00165ECB36|nr:MMPL family transporter [Haloferax sp. AS1]MBC9987969.1 RND transporter [Haloferax sp. AS1]